jgi:hypothetical protein
VLLHCNPPQRRGRPSTTAAATKTTARKRDEHDDDDDEHAFCCLATSLSSLSVRLSMQVQQKEKKSFKKHALFVPFCCCEKRGTTYPY